MAATQKPPSDDLPHAERYKELSTRQVAEYIGVTTTKSVWAYVKQGKLPKPRYINESKPLWRLGEVLDHTHGLMKAYDEAPRGFNGDEVKARTPEKPSSAAEKVRERLFGKGKA